MTGSAPSLTGALPPSGSPLIDGVSAAWSCSEAGGGGVELVMFVELRSGELAAGDGELWGSGVGVRSDRGEPDVRLPGTGDGFCWGGRRWSFSCSCASRACRAEGRETVLHKVLWLSENLKKIGRIYTIYYNTDY